MSTLASPSRASGWEWAQAVLLAVNLAWTTLGLGGYRPETMVISSALTGLLLAVHLMGFGLKRRELHPASGWLLPFLVYAAANVIWVSPARWLGWLDWLGWAQMIAVFWVVLNGIQASGPRRLLLGVVAAVGVAAVALASFQKFVQPDWLVMGRIQPEQYQSRPSGPFGTPNILAAFLLMLIPAAGLIGFRKSASPEEKLVGRSLLGLFSFAFVLTISRGGWIALALALSAWPLITRRVAWWRRLARSFAVFAAALLVGGALIATVPIARERFVRLAKDTGELSRPILWRAAWNLFRSAPATGTGAGSFNVLFERHRPEKFSDEPQWAHNEYLNTLSDYGLIGFALFFGPVLVLAVRAGVRGRDEIQRTSWSNDPGLPTALAVGLLALAVQMTVDFHLKIPALAMLAATLAAIALEMTWPARKAQARPARAASVGFGLAGIAAVLGFGLAVVPLYRAEAFRYSAKHAIERLVGVSPAAPIYRDTLAWVSADLLQAVSISPANGQAWADLAYATSLRSHVEPSRTVELGQEAEAEANRALALSEAHADFWIRRGVARDMQGKWLEGGNDFAQATSIAPRNALTWYYSAEHYYRRSTGKYLAEAALAFCLRLDPGNQAGLALRQRLAISQGAP